jgi:hypothetical protein
MLQPSLGVSSLDLGRSSERPLFVCVVGQRRISAEFVEEAVEWLSAEDVTFFRAWMRSLKCNHEISAERG